MDTPAHRTYEAYRGEPQRVPEDSVNNCGKIVRSGGGGRERRFVSALGPVRLALPAEGGRRVWAGSGRGACAQGKRPGAARRRTFVVGHQLNAPIIHGGNDIASNDRKLVADLGEALYDNEVAVALYNRGNSSAITGPVADISVDFAMAGIDLDGKVSVFDIWAKKAVGTFTSKYTAAAVPFHGTAFLRLSLASTPLTITV